MQSFKILQLKEKCFKEKQTKKFNSLIQEFLNNKDTNELRYKIFKQEIEVIPFEIVHKGKTKLTFKQIKVKKGFFYSFIKSKIYRLSQKEYFPISLSIGDLEQESFFIFDQFLDECVLKDKKYDLSIFYTKLRQGLFKFIQKYLSIDDNNKFTAKKSIERDFKIPTYENQDDDGEDSIPTDDEILTSLSTSTKFLNPSQKFEQQTKFDYLKEKIKFSKLSKNQERVLTKYYQLDREIDDIKLYYLSNQKIANILNHENELNNDSDSQKFTKRQIEKFKSIAIEKLTKLFRKKTLTHEITSNLFHSYEIISSLQPILIINDEEIKGINEIIKANKQYSQDKIFVDNYLKSSKKLISMSQLDSNIKEEKIFYPNTSILKTINLYNRAQIYDIMEQSSQLPYL